MKKWGTQMKAIGFIKNVSMKIKITFITGLLVVIGFVVMTIASVSDANGKVSEAMISQFINEATQVADQAEMILESGGSIEDLQAFVEREISDNSHFAYAVVIDKTVTAIAHSDTEKIGKNYIDDVTYTVDAAQNGTIKTSSFYADVQQAWTYDVMVPIYQDGELFGSMDVGIFNTEVDRVVASLRTKMIEIAIITILIICIGVALLTGAALKPFEAMVSICKRMGNDDFSMNIPEHMTKRQDEVGAMAAAMEEMRSNLASLLLLTTKQSKDLLEISKTLHETAENTQEKAVDISEKSQVAADGSEQQSELTRDNSRMTEEISKGMDEISNNITNISDASSATSEEAAKGKEKLDVVVNQMDDIATKVNATYEQIQELDAMSVKIQGVVKLIADIASQTNLLALNASIEAARAGEHGKGFAVVADEVSNPSDQSKDAANEIGKIISGIQESIKGAVSLMEAGQTSVQSGMELATEAKESFQGITERITEVSDEMTNVAAIIEEVNSGTASLFDAIERISSIAGSVSENTQDVSAEAAEQKDMMSEVLEQVGTLGKLSSELQVMLDKFTIEDEA
ncbi:MAG: methyl-accepting chemotaxis protein [Lachnospiraceae bacterium]|nr:methyl-accepting chemotaxis protein [Lachnospiraceae bacterium]